MEYAEQLEQVELALSNPECENREELTNLRTDLLELIELLKESGKNEGSIPIVTLESDSDNQDSDSDIIEFKPDTDSDIVDSIQNPYSSNIVGSTLDANSTDIVDSGQDVDSTDIVGSSAQDPDSSDIVGSRCRAPCRSTSNLLAYHNAIIANVFTDENEEVKAIVMYCNPLTRKMKPCEYYLKGTCTYNDKCRFSHGEIVNFSDLLEYEEPDFENVKSGILCLVKQYDSDELWKLGHVTCLSLEEQSAAVRLTDTQEEIEVSFENLLPLGDNTRDAESNSDDSDLADDEPCTSFGVQKFSTTPEDQRAWISDSMGTWEKHTKGVASKLMAKMGYVVGTGLGKNNRGIVEPIHAKVLPKSTSLDHCAQKSGKDPLKVAKLQKRKLLLKEKRLKTFVRSNSTLKSDVFQFLNKNLHKTTTTKKHDSDTDGFNKVRNLKATDEKELKLSLFKLQERIRAEEKRMDSHKSNACRNENKNKLLFQNANSKMMDAQKNLHKLRKEERFLANEIENRRNRRNLTIF